MKYKVIRPLKVIRLPELDINGKWKKVINWISRIQPVYWMISISIFLVLLFAFMPYHMWVKLWSGIKANGILVGMVLVFSLIAVSLVWTTCQGIDVWIFKLFNMYGPRAPWLDWMMLGLTQIGSGVFAMVIAFLLFLRVNEILAYELALGTLTLWLAVELLKVVIQRTRPYIKLDKIRIVGPRARGYSFPSGHTSQSFFIATLLAQYFHVGILVLLLVYAIAFLVGITRIYVGMHYPRDVLGGSILGTAWGFLGIIVNSYIWIR